MENLVFFISPRKISSLSEESYARGILDDFYVQKQKKEVERLSKIVFGQRKALANQLNRVEEYPLFVGAIAYKLRNDAKYFSKLSGFKILGIKSSKRKEAEKHISQLSEAFEKYVDIIVTVHQEITVSHEKKQMYSGRSVLMLSDEVRHLLDLPKDKWKKVLKDQNIPQIHKELSIFLNQINFCLLEDELKMLKDCNSRMLADSLGISKNKSQEIIDVVKKVKEMKEEITPIKPFFYSSHSLTI
ncbi:MULTISPECIES: BID domain-containing T4SS effector [unclassified Bartonella]|uniref:BID domain-containing T4SS effector n=1 Tax=unclassified Bartonella TaxID=2645622 RepID=UPI00099A278D|nr:MULTISPECIES: BID domain-containing T4SS effector [unclassified Bartonella]AQX28284.1 Bartonella effector protein Bep9/3 [Bartonella sp. JB15]AQX29555.1 Bartonella effector protein Bep9/3 [Bartonella sp. JB63]